ncbi:MAG TPA: DUF6159 family protein [Thermoplasmata archaeon]|nr:DUF6159 family protein [Thermoplasmata archaeon]
MHSTKRNAWGHRTREPPRRGGLRGHLEHGLHLTGTSLKILARDPQLLVFPFLALVLTGFVWLLVFVSLWALGFPPWSPSSGFLYQEMFVAYLITYFLSVYFMTAIIGATQARLRGERADVLEGVRAANRLLPSLVVWSLVAATVGGLLRLASLRWEGASRAIARVLGYTWPIATVFVVPAMVVEDVGPRKAFRHSRSLLRDVWGTRQTGVLGTGVVFAVLFLAGFAPFFWGVIDPAAVGWAVGAVLYWLLLGALWSVVHGILVTALYHYATASEASFGFSWQALNHPWVR